MKRYLSIALMCGAALVVAGLSATAGSKDKPAPSVTFARTWDAAVEEAKLLNLPIVIHNHGFY